MIILLLFLFLVFLFFFFFLYIYIFLRCGCILMYKYMQWDDTYDTKMQLMGHFYCFYIFFEMRDGIVEHMGA
jgi:hypothetical protein